MINATKNDFASLITDGLCVVEMSARWCPDCVRIKPIMDSLEGEYKEVKFILLDFDNNEKLKDELEIYKIPTLIFYANGKEVGERIIEPDSKTPIKNALDRLIKLRSN